MKSYKNEQTKKGKWYFHHDVHSDTPVSLHLNNKYSYVQMLI
jgi:hypothetical protein